MTTTSTTIEGKAVLVTGANRGLGRALVEEALLRGAARVYAGARQPFTHPDARVTPLTLDVTDSAHIQAAVERVESLDILINNAGISLPGDLSDRGAVDQHLAVNLFGTWSVTKAFLPSLTRSGGAVVNVVSIGAFAAVPVLPASRSQRRRRSRSRNRCALSWPDGGARSRRHARPDRHRNGPRSPHPRPRRSPLPGASSTEWSTPRRRSSPTPSQRRWPRAGAPARPRRLSARTRRSFSHSRSRHRGPSRAVRPHRNPADNLARHVVALAHRAAFAWWVRPRFSGWVVPVRARTAAAEAGTNSSSPPCTYVARSGRRCSCRDATSLMSVSL